MSTTEIRESVSPPMLLCSDLERIHVITILGSGFSEGRLTCEEFDHRVDEASTARYRSDLDALIADLPLQTPDAPETSLAAWLAIARHTWFQLCVDAHRLFRDTDNELRVGRCALGILITALVLIASVRGLLGEIGPAHLRH